MKLLARLILWMTSAAVALVLDVVTKLLPHPVVLNHYADAPILVAIVLGAALFGVGLWYSGTIAVGAGLMFGGLWGNVGQILLKGYATDWIPVGAWRTNVADVAAAIGLVCCFTGYARLLLTRRARQGEEERV
jgi:hypothetical protein